MPLSAQHVARAFAASLAIAGSAIATPSHAAGHSCFIDRVESAPPGVRVYFDAAADSTVSVRLKGETAYTRTYRTRNGKLRPGDDDQAVEQEFVELAEGDAMSMLNGPYDRCTVEVARHGGYIGVLAANVVSEPGASRVQEEFIPAPGSAPSPR